MPYELKGIFPPLPRTERGRAMVLGKDPKGKNFLYCNGNSVIIRNIDDPSICDVYTQHAKPTTVAAYSPSGFYICSADVTGKVRIWDTTQTEHILKAEYQPISGPIKDIAWTSDSQRIVVVGEGKGKFGHVFQFDTGTSVGTISGHTGPINACDMRPERPFRIATASEDQQVAFYHGPPFKFQFTMGDHSNFVNCVRYAPNGSAFCTGGADGKAFIFDGKTGEKMREVGSPAHKGGIYGVCYSPDSSQILTASADKTAKTWDAETGQLVLEFQMGTTLLDMQVGCLWQGEHMLTVSLSGNINYLDKNNTGTPLRVLKGHNKVLTSMDKGPDDSLYLAGLDPRICRLKAQTADCEDVEGTGHKSQVQSISVHEEALASCGMDDTVRLSTTSPLEYGPECLKVETQPKAVAQGPRGLTVLACINQILVLRNGKGVFAAPAPWGPLCVAFHPNGAEVAVGGCASKSVHVFSVAGETLEEKTVLKQRGEVTAVAYSRDGAHLAATDSAKYLVTYSDELSTSKSYMYHSARITCVSWSPDNEHVATGGLDTNIIVWKLGKTSSYIELIRSAHPMTGIASVKWLDERTLASAGHDCCVRYWSLDL